MSLHIYKNNVILKKFINKYRISVFILLFIDAGVKLNFIFYVYLYTFRRWKEKESQLLEEEL